MSYRIRYQLSVDWVPPGLGLGMNNPTGHGEVGGPAQTLTFFGSPGASVPNSTTFLSSDVTNLLASMSTDLSTQMNAQLARVQGFSTGGG
jgi:hypothetical protein